MSRRIHWLLLFSLIALALVFGPITRAQHGISWFAQYFNNHEFSLDGDKGHKGHFQQEGRTT